MNHLIVLGAAKFWILDPLYDLLGTVLGWLYRVVPSYGLAIVLLTVAVRLVLLPLTAKQAKSMQAMQRVQPEIKRLQAKYKGDRQKLNEELMKVYKEHQVNPLAGCLPVLLQMPLFIVLYRLILGLTRTVILGATLTVGSATPVNLQGAQLAHVRIAGGTTEQGAISGAVLQKADVVVGGQVVGSVANAKIERGTIKSATVTSGNRTVGTLRDLNVQGRVVGAPKNLPKDTTLYRSLQKAGGKMVSWGMDLARRPGAVHGAGAVPYYVLIILVVATGYYQQRQLTARTPKDSTNAQAQMMGKIFPAFFGLISFQIPAGVVVYFVVSNVWQIGQQAWIFGRQAPAGGAAPAKGEERSPRPAQKPPSGGEERPPRRAPKPPSGRGGRSGASSGRGSGRRPAATGGNGGPPGSLDGNKASPGGGGRGAGEAGSRRLWSGWFGRAETTGASGPASAPPPASNRNKQSPAKPARKPPPARKKRKGR